MYGFEGCAAALDIKADSIDGTIGAEERRGDRSLVMDVDSRGLRTRIWSGSRPNPPGVARCYPDLESVVEQMSDDPAAEKTGPAENRYQSAMTGCVVCKVIFRQGQGRHDLSILRKGGVAAPQDVPPCLLVNGHSEFERLVLLARGAVSVRSSVSEASTNCVTILRKSCRVGSTSRGAKQGSIVSVRAIANGSAKGQRSDRLDRDLLVRGVPSAEIDARSSTGFWMQRALQSNQTAITHGYGPTD